MISGSRGIAVIGMHRSGTSAVARGLQALSVYLGNDFLDAQPENPTGYWEDKGIVDLDERVLKSLALRWDDLRPIDPREFARWRIWGLRRKAMRYLRDRFLAQPLWGFKDPRTIRLLPFWRRVLRDCEVDDAYLLVIRNPASVAASLFSRQAMDVENAQRLWLVYMVPFLDRLVEKPLVVVDYDLLMLEPRGQLERIARRLGIRDGAARTSEVDSFVDEFLDVRLRHTFFSPEDINSESDAGLLTREAYALLYELAQDRAEAGQEFWSAWKRIQASWRTRLAWPGTE
ncbi:MAG TPA: sulfotransferase [Candidatus Cybelea sp.]